LSFSILFLTSTRAPLLGLFGGATLAALLFGLFAPDRKVRRIAALACVGAVIFSGAFFLARDTALIQGIKPLARVANMLEDSTTHSRIMNWGMAFEGFKERPILGWGHENYAAVFDKYYDPGMYAQEQWFDRTHNVIFDWLIAGGILGLLAYLSLYCLALLALWRSGAFALYERAIFTGLFAGYFFYLLFTFDNITSNILFIAILAYIAMRSSEKEKSASLAESWKLAKSAAPAVAGVVLLITPVIVWAVNADGMRQNYALISGLKQQPGGITENLENFERALSFGAMGTQEVREQIAQSAMKVAEADASLVSPEARRAFFEVAAREMKAQALEAPLNARAPYFGGVMHDTFGDHEEARKMLLMAQERSPQKQTILIALGANALARGESAAAMGYFKEAYESAPEYASARLYYAIGAVRTNDTAVLNTLLPGILKDGGALERQLLAAYASAKRYNEIVALVQEHIKLFPDDQQARLTLAVALFEGGNPSAAILSLEEAKRAIPAITEQADALIAQMKQR
jgi:tetratricopeptide (TPR) repeat protein